VSLIYTVGDRCRPKQLDTVVAIGDLYRFDRFALRPPYGTIFRPAFRNW
jgi:hypothetical protein